MSNEVAITINGNYMLIKVTGEPLSPDKIEKTLSKAFEKAVESDLNIIVHREIPVKQISSTIDFYSCAKLLSKFMFKNKLALVFPEEMHEDNLEFFETTSRNRGINTKLFSTLDTAVDWVS